MPNKKAAMKSLRQDKKKQERNRTTLSEIKTLVKNARALLGAKSHDEADKALTKLESKLSIAAKINVIKKKNASRRISRLRSQWAKIEK
ncbi:MAG: 30S ribosomal protein S20 [Candidatus Omnitrophota bacterium]